MAEHPGSLRRRVALSFVAYGAVVALTMAVIGNVINERIEREMWRSLRALDLAHNATLSGEALPGGAATLRVQTYLRDAAGVFDRAPPPAIAALGPGLHDDIEVDGLIYVVSVSDIAGGRRFLALDISQFETDELRYRLLATAIVLLLLAGLSVAGLAFGGRLIAPVLDLARRVTGLDPRQRGARLGAHYDAREVASIAAAVDSYLERLDGFVQRERDFLLAAEHELRTPMAVMAGALDVFDAAANDTPSRTAALQRIRRGTEDMDETLTALLYLAAEPGSAVHTDLCRIDEMLPEMIRDHEYLLAGKQVTVRLGRVTTTLVAAPSRIVYIAISNLLRNAIANSSAGQIKLTLIDGIFVIEDSGRGMTPEEISEAYRAEIRLEQRAPRGGGLGLYLIRRICLRFGWSMEITSPDGAGTRVQLDLRASLIQPSRR